MMQTKRRSTEAVAITIDDVAAHAGVSTMTVSRVLRSTGNVAASTVSRVQQSMEVLGYVPNRIASSLAAATPTQIAVIVPTLESTVFTELLSGISAALDSTTYQAIIGVTDYDEGKKVSLIRSMLGWRPAGIIIAGVQHSADAKKLLLSAGIPIVEVMEHSRTPVDMCIGVNQHAAGCAMAEHLFAKGYRRFAYIGSDHELDSAARKRFNGFNAVLKKRGAAFDVVLTDRQGSTINLGKKLMHQLVDSNSSAEVIYFSNDSVAVGALLYCMRHKIEVPKEYALASFSGLDIALAMPIAITTVSSPRKEMGLQCAKMIIDRIRGKNVRKSVDAGFELLDGEST